MPRSPRWIRVTSALAIGLVAGLALRSQPARSQASATLSLGDYVWQDLDADGLQAGEPGLAGAIVSLFLADGSSPALEADGNPAPLIFTQDDGYYRFDNLLPGEYVVRVRPPDGYQPTPQGGADADENPAEDDSNAQPVAGQTYSQSAAITLALESRDDLDFGFVRGGLCLGDLIFFDRDNDGRHEPAEGEFGIQGVSLRLFLDADLDGSLGAGDPELARGMSGALGRYAFCDLAGGDYIVAIDAANFLPGALLEGLVSSAGNDILGRAPDPNDDVDGDDNGDPVYDGGVASTAIRLRAGDEPDEAGDGDGPEQNSSLDFGLTREERPTVATRAPIYLPLALMRR